MSIPLAPPTGMRDLLPPHAAARARLASGLTRLFHRWGYDLVTTPPFEHAEVIERGLDTVDRRDLLRFVEPDTGEVALLRPDITPQIARIVATQLADRPAPWRLCYAGSLIRQRRGRARRQRQIAQAGVECIGLAGADADAEVIALAAEALEVTGLTRFRVELSLVGLTRGALASVPDEARSDAEEALVRKDRSELQRTLRAAGVRSEAARRLLVAVDLYGGVSLLRDARRAFRSKPGRRALRELEDVVRRLNALGLGERLDLDLGEVRGASYYTGVSFTLLAPGPGEAVGSGGRYDGLLARFGVTAPATGFGLDLSNLEWALDRAGQPVEADRPPRFVVAAGRAADRERVARSLRSASIGAAVVPIRGAKGALDYARRWGYDAAVTCRGEEATVTRVTDGRARRLPHTADDVLPLARWARAADRSEA